MNFARTLKLSFCKDTNQPAVTCSKAANRNISAMCKTCSKLTTRTSERRH